jgi:hypothetical protein
VLVFAMASRLDDVTGQIWVEKGLLLNGAACGRREDIAHSNEMRDCPWAERFALRGLDVL